MLKPPFRLIFIAHFLVSHGFWLLLYHEIGELALLKIAQEGQQTSPARVGVNSIPELELQVKRYCTVPYCDICFQLNWYSCPIIGRPQCPVFSTFASRAHVGLAGLGSIPFFQFNSNSNSVIFNSNSNSNSTTHNTGKFQFQFQFQFPTFQFQFQFRRIQIQSQFQKWAFDVFLEIYYDYNNKVHVYKIIVINTISLISFVKWL